MQSGNMSVPRAIDTGKAWAWNSPEYQDDLGELALLVGVPVSVLRLPVVLRRRRYSELKLSELAIDTLESELHTIYVHHFQNRDRLPKKERQSTLFGGGRKTRRLMWED